MPGPAMMTFKTRERTVCIDINGAHPEGKATWEEWSDFLDEDLGVDPLEVKEVGVHTLTRFLMLQTMSDNEYQRILSKLQEGVYWEAKDVTVHGWSHKEQLTTVKLMNVTGSLNINLLRSKIEEYGKIISWTLGKHPRYKNSFDNSITVKMMLKHEVKLPSFLPSPSTGEVIHLLSDTIGKACVRCLKSGHIAPYCRSGSKQFTEKTSSTVWSPLPDGASTYATAASKSVQEDTEPEPRDSRYPPEAKRLRRRTNRVEPALNQAQANEPSDIEHSKEAIEPSSKEPRKQTNTERFLQSLHRKEASYTETDVETTKTATPEKLDLNSTKGAFVEIETAGILTPGGTKQTNWAEEMESSKVIQLPSKLPEKTRESTGSFRSRRTVSLSQEEKQARIRLQDHARRKYGDKNQM